jgi:hypothetical protein
VERLQRPAELHARHIVFRSLGDDDDENPTTLCAFHHQRGVHGGVVTVRGRAPKCPSRSGL